MEVILLDRLDAIERYINQYGEENFYISFSGGKDSTVLHNLIDEALPGNTIPRVFINTGIEYKMIIDFVHALMENDSRIIEIKPTKNIKETLEKYGYPCCFVCYNIEKLPTISWINCEDKKIKRKKSKDL